MCTLRPIEMHGLPRFSSDAMTTSDAAAFANPYSPFFFSVLYISFLLLFPFPFLPNVRPCPPFSPETFFPIVTYSRDNVPINTFWRWRKLWDDLAFLSIYWEERLCNFFYIYMEICERTANSSPVAEDTFFFQGLHHRVITAAPSNTGQETTRNSHRLAATVQHAAPYQHDTCV